MGVLMDKESTFRCVVLSISAADAPVPVQVLGLTSNVRKMFKDMDEALYEECRLKYEAEEVISPYMFL